MLLLSDQLKRIMPTLTPALREAYLPWLNLAMARYEINNENRISMFLAQLAVESLDLTRWTENLNYSGSRLTEVWPKRFPTLAAAAPFAHNPRALADKVYNGRMGNRIGTDDGYVYRGGGPLQATGREMYAHLTEKMGSEFGVDFEAHPELLLQPKYGFLTAAYIFAIEKNCLVKADARDIVACTKAINGGTTGLADRKRKWEKALSVLPDNFQLDAYATLPKAISEPAPASHYDPVPHEDTPAPPAEPDDTDVAQSDPPAVPETPPPVVDVPQVTAAPDATEKSLFDKLQQGASVVTGRVITIWATIGTVATGILTWLVAAPIHLIYGLAGAFGAIGVVYLITHTVVVLIREGRIAKRDVADQALKLQREAQAHELQILTLKSAMDKDLNTVRIVPAKIENSDAPETPEVT